VIVRRDGEKAENHTPVIECPDAVSRDRPFEVKIKVVGHPNTSEHHISELELYVCNRYSIKVAEFRFKPEVAEPEVSLKIRLKESANLCAISHCNKHGLWESVKRVNVRST